MTTEKITFIVIEAKIKNQRDFIESYPKGAELLGFSQQTINTLEQLKKDLEEQYKRIKK